MPLKYNFYLLLIYFLLFHAHITEAQTSGDKILQMHTTGVVLNSETYKPVKGAKVTLVNRKTGKSVEMRTRGNGNFKFPIDQGNQYVLSAESGWYVADPTYISTSELSNIKVYNFIIYMNFSKDMPIREVSVQKNHNKLVQHTALATPPPPSIKILQGTFSEHKDLTFIIKIGEFVQPLPIEAEFLEPIQDKMSVKKMENGWMEYTVGDFPTYPKVADYQAGLVSNGYIDTKIIAYQQEEVVDISRLVAHYQQTKEEERLVSDR